MTGFAGTLGPFFDWGLDTRLAVEERKQALRRKPETRQVSKNADFWPKTDEKQGILAQKGAILEGFQLLVR
jgi:hypothetical protein